MDFRLKSFGLHRQDDHFQRHDDSDLYFCKRSFELEIYWNERRERIFLHINIRLKWKSDGFLLLSKDVKLKENGSHLTSDGVADYICVSSGKFLPVWIMLSVILAVYCN